MWCHGKAGCLINAELFLLITVAGFWIKFEMRLEINKKIESTTHCFANIYHHLLFTQKKGKLTGILNCLQFPGKRLSRTAQIWMGIQLLSPTCSSVWVGKRCWCFSKGCKRGEHRGCWIGKLHRGYVWVTCWRKMGENWRIFRACCIWRGNTAVRLQRFCHPEIKISDVKGKWNRSFVMRSAFPTTNCKKGFDI